MFKSFSTSWHTFGIQYFKVHFILFFGKVSEYIDILSKEFDEHSAEYDQPPNETLITNSDNCGYQFKNADGFQWMTDYVNQDDHSIKTMLAMFLAEYHGKGACDEEAGNGIHLQIKHMDNFVL